jgi:hypothetical protein
VTVVSKAMSEVEFYLGLPPFCKSPLQGKQGHTICDLVEVEELDSNKVSVFQKKALPEIFFVKYKVGNKCTKHIPIMKPPNYFDQPRNERIVPILRHFMYLIKLDDQAFKQYGELVVKLNYKMKLSEVLEAVLSCSFVSDGEIKERINRIITMIKEPKVNPDIVKNVKDQKEINKFKSALNPLVCEMELYHYLFLSLKWLDYYFAGDERIVIIDMEGDLPNLTYIPLAGQNIWWIMHMAFLPFQELYQKHIAPIIRPGSDIPYPCCFGCGESFATEYWMMLTTQAEIFIQCLDRYMINLVDAKSLDTFPIIGDCKTVEESVNKTRWCLIYKMIPSIAGGELYHHAIEDLDMTLETYLTFKYLLDVKRMRDKLN